MVENRLDIIHSVAGELLLQWRVFFIEIHDPAPTFLTAASTDGTPSYPWARWPGGVLVARGIEVKTKLTPVRTYDPTAWGERLLLEVSRLNPNDNQALLAFVNEWGLLGLAEPQHEVQLFDSLLLTRAALHRIKRLSRLLHAMQQGHWKSDHLPAIEALIPIVPDAPLPVTLKQKKQFFREAFLREFNTGAWGSPIRPLLISKRGDFHPYLRPLRLLDVLYLELWKTASAKGALLRQCEECQGLFPVKTSNQRKTFCTQTCKNRRNFRRWYARSKNRKKLQQKRKSR